MKTTSMWLARSKTRLFFDMHLPAWPGKGIAESFDPGRIAEAFAATGADSVVLFAKCQYGNFYTRLDGETLHPGLHGIDLLEELALRLRKGGVRTLAYYSASWDERIAVEHPEWLACNAEGERGKRSPRWKTLCINGPYATMVERHLAAIARKPVDGIWLDMTIIGDGNCYCERCAERYMARTGREPPRSADDPSFPEFLNFRYDVVQSFHARMREAVREAAPNLVFTNNYWGYPYSSVGMGSRAVGAASVADFVTGEAYSDWTGIRSASFFPIFLRGVAAGRPYETLIGRFINTWDYSKKPKAFLAYEAFAAFAHGATVAIDDQPYHDGRIDEALYREDITEVFREIRSHARTAQGREMRFAALYHSQKTKDRCADHSSFIRDIAGAFRLLRDLHFAVEFVFDESLSEETLEGIRLLLLPNVSEIAESEWVVLKGFMERGGLLVASGRLGGEKFSRCASESLGLHGGEPSASSVSYLRLPETGSRDILVRGRYATYTAVQGAAGAVIDPICETSPEIFFHNNLPAPYRESGVPGIIVREVGAGALALFPQPIFRHYAKEPARELRECVRALCVRHASTPSVELRIPMKMDFSVVEDGNEMYIHLLNPNCEPSLCCGLMEIYEGGFERSYEYMEETVPVCDLRILIRRGEPESVETLREGSPVEVRPVAEGFEITVARVEIWEIVGVRMKNGSR
jgi:hypothetical protein